MVGSGICTSTPTRTCARAGVTTSTPRTASTLRFIRGIVPHDGGREQVARGATGAHTVPGDSCEWPLFDSCAEDERNAAPVGLGQRVKRQIETAVHRE